VFGTGQSKPFLSLKKLAACKNMLKFQMPNVKLFKRFALSKTIIKKPSLTFLILKLVFFV